MEITVYNSKAMVFEDVGVQKFNEICEQYGEQLGRKKVCKSEAKANQNGSQMGARNRHNYKKVPGKRLPTINVKRTKTKH